MAGRAPELTSGSLYELRDIALKLSKYHNLKGIDIVNLASEVNIVAGSRVVPIEKTWDISYSAYKNADNIWHNYLYTHKQKAKTPLPPEQHQLEVAKRQLEAAEDIVRAIGGDAIVNRAQVIDAVQGYLKARFINLVKDVDTILVPNRGEVGHAYTQRLSNIVRSELFDTARVPATDLRSGRLFNWEYQGGMIASMMGGLDWASKSAWGNGIEKWAIRPSAQAFLTFAFYGPGNIAEMYLKSTLAGIPPALPWTPWSGFFGGKMVPRQQLAYMLKNMPPELLPTELLGMPPSNFFDPSFTWTPQTGFVKDSNWVTELLTFDWVSRIGSWAKYVNPYRVMVAVPGHITQNMQAHYLTQTMRRELVQNNEEVVSKLVNAWTKHEGLLETVPKNLRKLFESLANTNIMVDKGTFRQTIEQMIANKGSITVDNVIENGKHYNLPIGFTQQVKSDYSTGKIFKQSLKDYTDQLYEVYRKLEVTKPKAKSLAGKPA